VVSAGAAAAAGGAGAAPPPPIALTAFWQVGERLATFFCRHASAGLPPGGIDAQWAM
jgi:hypothetical protein